MSPDSMTWAPPRRLAAAYAVAIAILLIDFVITLWNLNSIGRTESAVAFSYDIVVGLDAVLSNLRDAETGQRGYLLTGDVRYLEPYTKSRAVVAQSVDRLRSLLAVDGVEREHVNAVAAATSGKLAELEETIQLRRQSGLEPVLAMVKSDRGKVFMDQIRSEIAAMRAREDATRIRLGGQSRTLLAQTTLTFLLTSALALILLIAVHLQNERSRAAPQPCGLVGDDPTQHGRCGDHNRRSRARHSPQPSCRKVDRMVAR